ncbi:putative F-box domain-containing protein [Helianthus annuus]|nr:putative F-box domain-containing protein [Helianthus annuus]KAJ0541832.1 putative F-box domain-containing protein [Helianthus annuus]KAJ0706908.1 putative F-box domain-containing protein [Helianthus annuus]KAJ0710927.1 putative F-box domain-containing protein [Helianthus annuus]KAJ0887541.1 putative F-box domain-containing protein [Helianthus annuus]
MSEHNIPNPDLPNEIIIDILSRLPVKSLLQFRRVSKHFRNLISDTRFIKSHLKKAEALSTHHRILVPTSALLSLNYNLSPNDINASIELNCPFLNSRNAIKILGSCNGLVCIIDGSKDLTIYNPSTRRYFKPFRSPQALSGSNESNQIEYVYGFGYGSNPSDLRLIRFPRFGRDSGHIRFGIYDFIDTAGTFLNGSLHWLARHSNIEDQNRVIASFDVSKQTFSDVYLPPQEPNLPYYMLGVLKGCLYAIGDGVFHTEVEVWLMKEYGVVNSWSKFVKIPVDMWTGSISYMRPLRSVNDDEIVVEIDLQSFAIYDTTKKTFRRVKGVGNLKWFGDATVYVESLVSPQVSCMLY